MMNVEDGGKKNLQFAYVLHPLSTNQKTTASYNLTCSCPGCFLDITHPICLFILELLLYVIIEDITVTPLDIVHRPDSF
jgi:hypothetical protein